MKNKKLIALVCTVLLLVGAAGATLAWLMDQTTPVTNTFTAGDVDIELTETWNTDADGDGTNDSWSAQMIPGQVYSKNPVVTVTTNTNVDCYLFVKFEEKNGAATYLDYTSTLTTANLWTQGDGTRIPSDVWYRAVTKAEAAAGTATWNLLDGNTVTINATEVTKDTMAAAEQAELVYTAYAVQKDNVADVFAAWELLFPTED